MDADPTCARCGRVMAARKRWQGRAAEVRWCSEGCRRAGLRAVDHDLEATILALLAGRAGGATICPSEAARAAAGPGAEEAAWRALVEPARMAARRLVAAGRVDITQRGRVVDPSTARGPIRIRLRRHG